MLNSVAFRLIIWPVLRKATGCRYSLISELWRKQAIKGTRTRHSESQSVQGQTGQFMDLNTAAGCFWLILWDSKDAPRMYYYIMYAELLLCATATARMKITRSRQPRELVSVPLMYAWRLVILSGGGPLRCDVVRYGTGEGADTYLYTNWRSTNGVRGTEGIRSNLYSRY